jgi:polyisoprenoid-binding protein YceI
MKSSTYLLIPGLLAIALAAQAAPITFTVSGGEGNLIKFESKAPLETVTGTTSKVTGTITVDPTDLGAGVSAMISVDAASIKTGNGIRDGHMRDNHLHAKDHPEIRFSLNNFALDGALQSGVAKACTVVGEFSLHGVTKTISVPVEVTYMELEGQKKMRVVGSFSVTLSEYNIPRPQFLVMRLDEVQKITIDFWGSAP